jgi:photosynthetic reaction center H subunit
MTGAITGYIDVAQLTLYAFWIFFAGLIYYLRREDKREGYPLVNDRSSNIVVQGFPFVPAPKVFRLPHGGVAYAPRIEAQQPIAARPAETWPGAPLVPTGNPMIDGIGPASYAMRADTPDMTFDDHLPRIIPLRADPTFLLASEDPDPRGFIVYGADRVAAGVVVEAWIDRSEIIVRYLEVEVQTSVGPRPVLLPMNMVKINAPGRLITVRAITAAQFATVPGLRNPNEVTLLEEDKILGYYGGGTLYALPNRTEPLL